MVCLASRYRQNHNLYLEDKEARCHHTWSHPGRARKPTSRARKPTRLNLLLIFIQWQLYDILLSIMDASQHMQQCTWHLTTAAAISATTLLLCRPRQLLQLLRRCCSCLLLRGLCKWRLAPASTRRPRAQAPAALAPPGGRRDATQR
jgi:hypothetical protein